MTFLEKVQRENFEAEQNPKVCPSGGLHSLRSTGKELDKFNAKMLGGMHYEGEMIFECKKCARLVYETQL